jgi:hypothetical protein
MSTTEQILTGFTSIIARMDDKVLCKELSQAVYTSIHKHREDDVKIEKLKINIKLQIEQFHQGLETLEDEKCPHLLAKTANYH